MKNIKYADILLWAAALVSLILSIITAVFGFTSESAFSKVILIIVAILFLLLTAMVAYLAYINTFANGFSFDFNFKGSSEPDKANYFLNPEGKKKGLSADSLNFDLVNDRVNDFLVESFGSPLAMWKNEIFAEEDAFGKDGVFKTLVVYKMLYDLQSHHSKKIWSMFLELPEDEFSDMCACLARNGEEEFLDKLKDIKASEEGKLRDAVAYLDENEDYIKRRMVNYVKRNIKLFDIE